MTHPLFQWRKLERHPMQQTERYFFSPKPFVGMRHVDQKPDHKPAGLWYACGSEWLDWVEHEWPSQLDDWRYLYKLTLGKNILHINTPEETFALAKKYATSHSGRPVKVTDRAGFRNLFTLDWERISEKYNGIEICPYHWDLRYEMLWYSTWDVASGCVWDPKGLGRVELVATAERDWQLEAV